MTGLLSGNLVQMSLSSLRIGGLLVSMPVFGAAPIPLALKIIFALGMGVVLAPFTGQVASDFYLNNTSVFLLFGREVAIGLFIGFVLRFVFLVVSFSLEFAGLQMGFSIANVLDPQNNSQISVIAQLGTVLMVLVFLGMNFHHDVFRTIIMSYQTMPIQMPDWDIGGILEKFVFLLGHSFEIALRLAVPVMVVMLTIHLIIGVISRTAPQMNLFFNIAFVVNIVVGLIFVIFSMPSIIREATDFGRLLQRVGFGLW